MLSARIGDNGKELCTTSNTDYQSHFLTSAAAALPVVLFIAWYNKINPCREIMRKAASFSPPLYLISISQYLFCHANPRCPKLLDGLDRFLCCQSLQQTAALSPVGYLYHNKPKPMRGSALQRINVA